METEYEIYMNEVAGHLAEFMNGVMDGDKQIVTTTTEAMKNKFALTIEQEAAVKIALVHLELLANQIENMEALKHFVGLEVNILTDVVMKNWHGLVNDRLE